MSDSAENVSLPLEDISHKVMALVKPIGAYMREQRKSFDGVAISKKGIRDFVTEVDMQSERQLVAGLRNIFPDAGFVTEENTVEQIDTYYKWIIDPLDGTMNYVHGIPIYSISIALQAGNKFVLGVVYEVANDEMFYTWQGAASYCNGKIISVSACHTLQDALIATGFPYIRNDRRTREISNTLKFFLDNGRDIRRLGTAATDLCYVACGRQDVYYEGFLNIWDIAAGILILQNAGGVAVNFKGEENYNEGRIVGTNPNLIGDVLRGISF